MTLGFAGYSKHPSPEANLNLRKFNGLHAPVKLVRELQQIRPNLMPLLMSRFSHLSPFLLSHFLWSVIDSTGISFHGFGEGPVWQVVIKNRFSNHLVIDFSNEKLTNRKRRYLCSSHGRGR